MEKNIRWGKVISYAGAFIAFLIGSGFATGQEVLQYFSSYGYSGILGVLMVFILFLYVGADFMLVGQEKQFKKGNDIYRYYCGKVVGTFYDYFSIAFIYMSFIVMIGGAGATVNQQYGLPETFGGVLIGVLAVATVVFGLGRIVDVIGKIGPAIVLMTIFLGIAALIKNPSGVVQAQAVIPQMTLMKASTNWFYAAGSYVGFCMLWLAAFMASMGATSISKKEAVWGSTLGALGFSVGLVIITLGIMANIEQLAGTMVPSLVLAGNISSSLAVVFSFIVVAGIYTTSVPLLWTVVSRFAEEKTSRFRLLTVVFAAVGVFIGLRVPFDRLVNIIYVINGYVGILLLVFMIIKRIGVMREKVSLRVIVEE
ncbi:MAG: YkvI family membrane protein [Bacillota bacterium]